MDSVLIEAERLHFRQQHSDAVNLLRRAEPSGVRSYQAARRRLLAWALLATGETKQAYEVFWSCAHHEGARAGILLLTVLAGQVETAVSNWQRYCDKLNHPPASLPDERWHSPRVVKPALQILQRYPFKERSVQKGAAALYEALLHQSQGDVSSTFQALAKVTDFYPPARLLRDTWMDDLLCLPLPKGQGINQEAQAEAGSPDFATLTHRTVDEIVQRAAQLLLYPDQEVLEEKCEEALREGRFLDALEALRRLLFLNPQHTPSLERRWRLYLELEEREAAKDDLFFLMDVYEREKQIVACQKVAAHAVTLFPEDERALLKMCFLQARLDSPNRLAQYGRRLLELCRAKGLHERGNSYRRWLLRQGLALDDRADFEVS